MTRAELEAQQARWDQRAKLGQLRRHLRDRLPERPEGEPGIAAGVALFVAIWLVACAVLAMAPTP